ncbi:hypothetical protein OZN62_04380 [Aurantiacibacter sp. MUD11]|uniref:hypothetical protein n=1 Tax=Aurantiacibacter sp. MUD11 TaxID=3003265 RepID=UPI0022AB4058|nr:hypothetical protein [Aurantiacibacter sp. MUD11]WAT18812.1 hypothetical protein OZN62_04380 [Aurantiacibacter sp. MUD11]
MRWLVLLLYSVVGIVSVAMGSLYILTPRFMPYHAVAIGRDWTVLSGEEQVLYLALLDVAGAGWVALGVAVLWLVMVPIRRGEQWARFMVPCLLLIFYLPTLLATISVLDNTPASPPWWGNVIALAVTVIAFVVDRPFRRAG